MNYVAVDHYAHVLCGHRFSLLLGGCLGAELLGYVIRTTQLFSQVAAAFSTPRSNVRKCSRILTLEKVPSGQAEEPLAPELMARPKAAGSLESPLVFVNPWCDTADSLSAC